MHVGNDGLGVRNIITNVGNDYVCVYCKFGLEADGRTTSNDRTQMTERTLKT